MNCNQKLTKKLEGISHFSYQVMGRLTGSRGLSIAMTRNLYYSNPYGFKARNAMGIYLTPEFEAERRNARVSDKILCRAAKTIFLGLKGDRLGKFTFKKRLALPAVSARDGARTILFFNQGKHIYFFDMYLKSKISKKKGKELEDDEIDAYCKIAEDFVALNQWQINHLLDENELIEVICDD